MRKLDDPFGLVAPIHKWRRRRSFAFGNRWCDYGRKGARAAKRRRCRFTSGSAREALATGLRGLRPSFQSLSITHPAKCASRKAYAVRACVRTLVSA